MPHPGIAQFISDYDYEQLPDETHQIFDLNISMKRVLSILTQELGERPTKDHQLYQALVQPFEDTIVVLMNQVMRREKVRSYGTRKCGADRHSPVTPSAYPPK